MTGCALFPLDCQAALWIDSKIYTQGCPKYVYWGDRAGRLLLL